MCFDPGSLIVLTSIALTAAGAQAIESGVQTKAQNQAASMQYQYQLRQSQLTQQAAQQQLTAQVSQQHVSESRQAENAYLQSQQAMLTNQQRQATAVASAASSGITGEPLSMLFNDYQVSAGNIASNLQTTYQQLNQNAFFGDQNATLQGQSIVNQSSVAHPYMAQFSPWPAVVAGLNSAVNTGVAMYEQTNPAQSFNKPTAKLYPYEFNQPSPP